MWAVLVLYFSGMSFSPIPVIFGNKPPVLVWLVVNGSQVTTVAILWLFVVWAPRGQPSTPYGWLLQLALASGSHGLLFAFSHLKRKETPIPICDQSPCFQCLLALHEKQMALQAFTVSVTEHLWNWAAAQVGRGDLSTSPRASQCCVSRRRLPIQGQRGGFLLWPAEMPRQWCLQHVSFKARESKASQAVSAHAAVSLPACTQSHPAPIAWKPRRLPKPAIQVLLSCLWWCCTAGAHQRVLTLGHSLWTGCKCLVLEEGGVVPVGLGSCCPIRSWTAQWQNLVSRAGPASPALTRSIGNWH